MKRSRFFFFFTLIFSIFVLSFGLVLPGFGDVVKEAEKAFMDNKPKEAIPLLETAIHKEPQSAELYLYLGIAHEQLKQWDAAVQAYKKALPLEEKTGTLWYNIGNNYNRLGQIDQALDAYGKAIEAEKEMPGAYLNRANLLVKKENYEDAVADYRVYLSMKPNSSQKQNIEKMVSLLSEKIRVAERKRREEELRREEKEKQRKEMLDQVLNSLEESSEETKNISAGTGDVKEYEEDFDIVE